MTGYRQSVDRDRSAAAAALVRVAAARWTGIDPTALTVRRTCGTCERPHGRPTLPGTGVHVSVSHAGRFVVVAITDGGPVGIDVEHCSVDHADLVAAVRAPQEAADLSNPRDFYAHWTRKEAVLKATGAGLAVPMTEVVLSPPREAPALLGYAGGPPLRGVLVDLTVPQAADHAAALAVLDVDAVRVIEHDLCEAD